MVLAQREVEHWASEPAQASQRARLPQVGLAPEALPGQRQVAQRQGPEQEEQPRDAEALPPAAVLRPGSERLAALLLVLLARLRASVRQAARREQALADERQPAYRRLERRVLRQARQALAGQP